MAIDPIVELRAQVAMRREDLRIARKHRDQAAARKMKPESLRALRSADRWVETCAERERQARVALIGATS